MENVAEISGSVDREDRSERRLVSILFTDMVGYTAIVESLGEERAVHFTRMIYQMLTDVVQENQGVVRGFAGDSIMAIFGIPEALEDPALRACGAALDVHRAFEDAADDINARFGVRPIMRVGVSSGTVIVTKVEGQDAEMTAVGNTVNLASRIQALAPEGGCLVCANTRSLVQWYADVSFEGEFEIKGIAQQQKLWRLISLREGATRFDASLGQGLTHHIGRDTELAALETALGEATTNLRVADLVAEPGLGKTRLVYEFQRTAEERNATIYAGHCTLVGKRAPFLPFIEVLRDLCDIRDSDDAALTEEKLKLGLASADLQTEENLGLLLNLLGLTPPEGALDHLDGVLIGLRTRDLIPAMLFAQCEARVVVLLLEDVHWIDDASEELLARLCDRTDQQNLLILTTRRPEYQHDWQSHDHVRTIALQPLSESDIRHLSQTRLGVDELPEALIRQVVDRAGGNPLFGEEILSFMTKQGALRIEEGTVIFDAERARRAVPTNMQGLLSARIAQLQPDDRAVLQAAAAIGRRFDPGLLSNVVGGDHHAGAALQRMEQLDIIRPTQASADYAFKHVLLRDTVYQSLLEARRSELHLAIAQTLEIRNSYRLSEAAETLAYHYSQTSRSDLAFTYNAMAGAKSLGVFSHDQANQYFAAALALYEADPGCVSDAAFVEFLGNYALCSNISLDVMTQIDMAVRLRPVLGRIGGNGHHVLYLHHYVSCLIANSRFVEALSVQRDLSAMAERLGDPKSRAYAMVNELSTAIYTAALSNDAFAAKRAEIEALLTQFDDAYLQNFFLATLGWNEVSRGRVKGARETAERLVAIGTQKNDPRGLGYGAAMNALVAVVTDDHDAALALSEEARRLSRAEFEIAIAESSRVGALVALQREGALQAVEDYISARQADGCTLFAGVPETMRGVGLAMEGRVTEGLAQIEETIARREAEGASIAADWNRLTLSEVYLQIISGDGGASLGVLLANFRTIAKVILSGEKRIRHLIETQRKNPHFEKDGHFFARGEMILGLLAKRKKRKQSAIDHLTRAQKLIAPAGQSPMLARIEGALAELLA